jgi:hypothetical protein
MWSSLRTLRPLRSLLLLVAILAMSGCATGKKHGEYHPYTDTSMEVEQANDICKMEADRSLRNTGWGLSAFIQSEEYMHSCMAGYGYRH